MQFTRLGVCAEVHDHQIVYRAYFFTSTAGAVANYCDEYVCVCVCLSARISPEPYAPRGQVVVMVSTHTKIRGNHPRGSTYGCQNVFCCVLLSIQCGLSATYPAPILSIFEIKDVNRCAHV